MQESRRPIQIVGSFRVADSGHLGATVHWVTLIIVRSCVWLSHRAELYPFPRGGGGLIGVQWARRRVPVYGRMNARPRAWGPEKTPPTQGVAGG